ncbi:hypothetical protein P152DRAFT_446927 [Eremomyces bilateralis CBS 781.70]|uniref:Uncharacterized protein n=1 Tax=Eremomyces bilateralis CBS 781.70 TaxID=1392243 RepID=A0A6G1GDG1_9PEZI|nr:uncharacterized protein P152DRAFT_446927 [Eremomyces bilateralis CBS 781.70]KAF1815931.1 hypothetical protein P152DRAFT_446927 [Eremomyces bilateralis CBS 781.70]
MKYIRFLKATKLESGRVSSLITITSDLGESFYQDNVNIHLSACAPFPDETVFARKTVRWVAGMRALPIMLDLDRRWHDQPFQVRASVFPNGLADRLGIEQGTLQLPAVLSAWSDVLRATDLRNGRKGERWTAERRIEVSSHRIVRCWEDIGETIVGHIWDAGVAMSAFIASLASTSGPPQGVGLLEDLLELLKTPPASRPLRIIELGTGTGILGLTFAQCIPNASLVLTDEESGKTLAQRSITATLGGSSALERQTYVDSGQGASARFEPLVWGVQVPKDLSTDTGDPWDIICASDCTYNSDSSPALVSTMAELAGQRRDGRDPLIVVGMKRRHDSEEVFFDLMEKSGFEVRDKATIPLAPAGADVEEEVEVWLFGLHS